MIPPGLEETIRKAALMLPGWQSPERSLAHAMLALSERPKCMVEIGVYGGRSLIPCALVLKWNQFGKVYGIDPWHKETAVHGVPEKDKDGWSYMDFSKIHEGFMNAVRDYGVEDYVVPIRAKSQDARSLFGFGEIDILHIDGSHDEEDAVQDVKSYLPLMKHPGGYIWLDDTDFPSLKRAVRLLDDRAELQQNHGTFRLYRV